ncbi:hypothetical protein [Microbacterium sp. JZ31]|uniref:hypothetical protein n=1 Tax=Microbacterium sp. JZ31 TaxID=1906274 RepID=UPI00300CC39D
MPDPIDSARELLLERRSDAARRLEARTSDLSGVAAARGDATADDEHDPEGSTLSGSGRTSRR